MKEDTSKAGRVVGLFFKRDAARSAETANRIMNARYPGEDVRFVVGEGASRDDSFARMAFAVSIGGDGTFLRTARAVRDLGIPLFGVNTGRLGFLTSGTPESAADDVRSILAGGHRIVDRLPLKGEVLRGGTRIGSLYALNEAAVIKNFPSRPIDLDVSAGGGRLCRFLADGVIVSTPTGSTAYALSAGGPIVHPDVKCLVVVPVCPHSLYLRPVVLGENEVVEIRIAGESAGPGELSLSEDGQHNIALEAGDAVRLSLDREKLVRVIRLDEASYYDALKSKFNWGSSGERDVPGAPPRKDWSP